jgi:glycosyltransferase involved in cell wall biosynthesis
LAELYALADVCVYPAASSMSCLEAAACGVAVIMTDLPAGRWRAEKGVGLCYRTGDIEDLRSLLAGLLGNPVILKEAAERGRAAVLHHFSYDQMALRSEAIMRQAIESNRTRCRQHTTNGDAHPH